MPNTATTSQVDELIDELKEMASGKTDAARLGEIAATARRMDDAGQTIEACNIQGMAAALRGDTFEVERLFNAALQRGGNDVWTLGNYAAALNILASGLCARECERPSSPAREGPEHHRPQFFDAMPGYFYTLLHRPDGSYAIPLVSDAIRDLYDLGPEVTTNDYSALLALVHPDDVAPRQRKLDESERDLGPFHAEYRIVLPQIGVRWIEAHALPKRTGDGGTRWDGFINDITERKLMEDELRLKEFVLDQARIGVYLIDECARFIYVNDAACRALGYSREELLTKTTMDINDDHSVEASMAVRQKTLEEGACTFETRHVRRDGSLFPVEVWACSLEYRGKVIGVALAADITERKCMEAELAAREREFRSLAENSPDNIVRWDVDGRYLYINPAHERTLGARASDIVGTIIPATHPHVKAGIAQVAATGQAMVLVRQTVVVDGKLKIHEVRLAPERNADGRIVSVLGLGRDMTGVYRMQETLAAREREFRSLAENSPDNIARYDCALRLVYLNPSLADSVQVRAEDVIGKYILEAFPEEDFSALADKLIETMRCGIVADFQVVIRDRGVRIHHLRITPEHDKLGEVVGALVIGRDMTDIYRMQETIAAREQEYRTLVENFPDVVIRYDTNLRRIYVNSAMVKLAGVSPGELIGETSQKASPLVDPDGYMAELRKVMESGVPSTLELSALRPNGEQTWNLGSFVPEFDAEGKIVGVLMVARDITAIREAERRLKYFIDNLPGFAFIFRVTPDGHLSFPYASLGIYDLYGLQPEDVKDDAAPLHALAHPDDQPHIVEAIFEAERTTTPFHIEFRVCRPGLPEHWLEVNSVPDRQADGSILWYGIMLDITERKQAEQALEDSRIQLRGLIAQREEAREEERRYIAREIHDNLGQVLSGLRLNISRFVRRYAANSEEMQAHLRNTGELVDLAVKEVRNISAALRPVELDMDIRSALFSHLERFGAYTGIACELNAGADVDLTVEAHKLALYRIVQESLTNVARHAQASKVEIALRMEPPHCILCIRDNGVGFDPGANKPKSFGLVGMRERATMLGGSVIIDSSPGKGTEIVVRIPVQKIMEKS